MAEIDDLLRRLRADAALRRQVIGDPRGHLAGRGFDRVDLERISGCLEPELDVLEPVAQRTARAGLFALFGSDLVDRSRRRRAGSEAVGLAPVLPVGSGGPR